MIQVLIGFLFVKSIDALIHPGMVALIAAQHTIKPVVAGLMHHYSLQSRCCRFIYDCNCRVFHAAACMQVALHCLNRFVLVGAHPFAIMPYGFLQEVGSLLPFLPVAGHESRPCSNQGVGAGSINRILPHYPAFIGKPRKIVYIIFMKVQCFHFLRAGNCAVGCPGSFFAVFGSR